MNFDRIIHLKEAATQLSFRLSKYKQQSIAPFRGNFRCDICGDSQKNKHKKRGFLLEEGGNIFKYCHNCGYSAPLELYLKDHQPDIYQQLTFQLIQNNKPDREEERPIEKIALRTSNNGRDKGLVDIIKLPRSHVAVQYVLGRELPVEAERFYYVDKFYTYVNKILKGKFSEEALKHDHPRLVLPMRDENGLIFGVIGRDLSPDSDLRYLTIKFDEDENKIYGLERLNRGKHAYVTEGPIDSLFVDNCIALAGTDGDPDKVFSNKNEYTMILDNQPRNREVVKKYQKYIRQGSRIVIWPKGSAAKDINDMILDGWSHDKLHSLLRMRTYQGFGAQLEFELWRCV